MHRKCQNLPKCSLSEDALVTSFFLGTICRSGSQAEPSFGVLGHNTHPTDRHTSAHIIKLLNGHAALVFLQGGETLPPSFRPEDFFGDIDPNCQKATFNQPFGRSMATSAEVTPKIGLIWGNSPPSISTKYSRNNHGLMQFLFVGHHG